MVVVLDVSLSLKKVVALLLNARSPCVATNKFDTNALLLLQQLVLTLLLLLVDDSVAALTHCRHACSSCVSNSCNCNRPVITLLRFDDSAWEHSQMHRKKVGDCFFQNDAEALVSVAVAKAPIPPIPPSASSSLLSRSSSRDIAVRSSTKSSSAKLLLPNTAAVGCEFLAFSLSSVEGVLRRRRRLVVPLVVVDDDMVDGEI